MAKPPADQARLLEQRSRVAGKAPPLDEILRGTLRRRYIRCGNPRCHCRKGRGHGPFLYLSVTLGVGRTRQITIAPGDYAAAVRYVRNYSRLREVLEAISTLNRKLFQARLLSAPPGGAKKTRRRQ